MSNKHFTDALLDDLVINDSYSTWENIDWARLDAAVTKQFGSLEPGDGPTYISSNGTFINNFGDVHADLCYWAAKQGILKIPEALLADNADWDDFLDFIHTLASNPKEGYVFVGEPLNYLRCNNDKYQSYVILPSKVNKNQLYSLEAWLEHLYEIPKSTRPSCIEFSAYNNEQNNTYDLDDYDSEALIKIAKRFYSSGKFYESKLKHIE